MLLALALGSGAPAAPALETPQEGAIGIARTAALGDGETSQVRVRVSKPEKTILTAITFPAPIREIVSAWNEKDLSVEHSGERLFLKLLSPSQGNLDAILTTGRLFRLYVVPAEEGRPYDASLQIQGLQCPEVGPSGSPRLEPRGAGSLELVRAMRLGENLPGVTVRRGEGVRLFGAKDVDAKLAYVYESAFYRGYVVRLENASPSLAYEIDLPRIHAEDLVLVGAKNLVVDPVSFTYLYLVFWKK